MYMSLYADQKQIERYFMKGSSRFKSEHGRGNSVKDIAMFKPRTSGPPSSLKPLFSHKLQKCRHFWLSCPLELHMWSKDVSFHLASECLNMKCAYKVCVKCIKTAGGGNEVWEARVGGVRLGEFISRELKKLEWSAHLYLTTLEASWVSSGDKWESTEGLKGSCTSSVFHVLSTHYQHHHGCLGVC